jgi:hypothetical protein
MRFDVLRRWMTGRPWRGLVLGAFGWIRVLGGSDVAAAATPDPPVPGCVMGTPCATANVARELPVLLVVHGDSLDGPLLEAELGREVVLGAAPGEGVPFGVLTIAHRPAAKELAVTWERGGQTLTRLVAAPPEAASVETDAVLLAGNLAREQVARLLPSAPETPAPAPPPPAASHDAEAAPPERWAATFGVFYPLSTHYGHADVTSGFDLNLLYSRVGGIDGGQLGDVNVVVRDDDRAPSSMRGLQLGFLANLVAGEVHSACEPPVGEPTYP